MPSIHINADEKFRASIQNDIEKNTFGNENSVVNNHRLLQSLTWCSNKL